MFRTIRAALTAFGKYVAGPEVSTLLEALNFFVSFLVQRNKAKDEAAV